MGRATKLKTMNGRKVSAKSKTGDPACSAAASALSLARKLGGLPANVAKVLAACRGKARQNSRAAALQASGKLAPGRGTADRTERARALLAQRSATRAAARPTLRQQADSTRSDRGLTPAERQTVAADKRSQRNANPRDLKAFSDRVNTVASKAPESHRFAGKVYIKRAHEAYQKAHGAIPLATFKRRLLEAHTKGQVQLSRIDMAEAASPSLSKASEIKHPGGLQLHVIRPPAKATTTKARPDLKAIAAAHRASKGDTVTRIVGRSRAIEKQLMGERPKGMPRTPQERAREALRRDALAQAQRMSNPQDQVIDTMGLNRLRKLLADHRATKPGPGLKAQAAAKEASKPAKAKRPEPPAVKIAPAPMMHATADEAKAAHPVGTKVSAHFGGMEPSVYRVSGHATREATNGQGRDTHHTATLAHESGFAPKGVKTIADLHFQAGNAGVKVEPHKPAVEAPKPAAPGETHAKVKGALGKIFGDEPDDRGLMIGQVARRAGIAEPDAAAYVHGMVKRGIAQYDHFNDHDAMVARQFGTVHTDPDTGKPIAAFRIFRHHRLDEMGGAS